MLQQSFFKNSIGIIIALFLVSNLFAQDRSYVEEVWTDMRPKDGTAIYIVELINQAEQSSSEIEFSKSEDGQIMARFVTAEVTAPSPNKNTDATTSKFVTAEVTKPTTESKFVTAEVTSPVSILKFKKRHAAISFTVIVDGKQAQFEGELSKNGKWLIGTIIVEESEEPIELKARRCSSKRKCRRNK